jgi:hypothetical protein
MKKTAGIIAAPIVAAILLFAALSSCSGHFIDPGMADMDRGGMGGSGGSGGGGSGGSGSGSGNSGGNSNAGILTFTDGVPDGRYFSGDVFIIDNKTDTSKSDWKSAKIIAHYNDYFEDQDVTNTTLRLSIPKRSLTVSNHSDISHDDKVWTGGGTYTIYVSYYDYSSWSYSSVEKILKGVSFKNGCATVKWSNFTEPSEEDGGGGNNTSDITYTATANNTTNTTAIYLDFDEAVSGLTTDNITITDGTGSVTKGTLTGSGSSWTLGITVITAGTVKVKITKSGIESETKTVTVSKGSSGGGGDNTSTITYTAEPDTLDDETTGIWFFFSATVSGLTASDIMVTNGTGSVTKGWLILNSTDTTGGTIWVLNITVITAGNITVKITKNGIESGTKTVTVSKGSSGGGGSGGGGVLDGTSWADDSNHHQQVIKFTGSTYNFDNGTSIGTYTLANDGKDLSFKETSPGSKTYKGYYFGSYITANFVGANVNYYKK